jgi:thiamine-monophosphate kinase
MDERAALSLVADLLPTAGDDAAVVENLVLTTDMLHDRTDFPDGTTRYTAGWRAVGASLSDVAGMGADALAAVAVYAVPAFEEAGLRAFIEGARDVCEAAGGEYVGGDLDGHDEFTVATTAIGRTDSPVRRSGATPGESVCVTGTLGRSGAGLRLFRAGKTERANALFRFQPRVETGLALADAGLTGGMMDSSDGLARSLHQLADASGCGFAVESDALPVDGSVDDVAEDEVDRRELAVFLGEDFELVFTTSDPERARTTAPVAVTEIGRVTDDGAVRIDGRSLPDRGYTH